MQESRAMNDQPAKPKPPPARAAHPPAQAAPKPRPPVRHAPRHLSPQEELEVLIRARYPVIYVVSWEEERVERCLREIAEKRGKNLFVWTVTQGIVKSGVEPQQTKLGGGNTADPLAALDAVIQQVQPAIYLFKDFHRFTVDDRCNLTVIRRLRDTAYHLRDTYKSLVIVAPSLKISQELAKDVTVVEFGLPRIEDFDQLLERIIEDVKDTPQVQIDLDADARERLLHAATGLTLKEAENVFAKTLVLNGKLDADDVSVIFSEKQQIIKKSGLLEYYETSEDFSQVAGLDNLKQWLSKRRSRFYRPGRPFRAFLAARRDAPGRAGLRQEPVRQGRGQPVEPPPAALRLGPECSAAWSVPAKRTSAGRSRRPKASPRSSSGSTKSTRRWPARPPRPAAMAARRPACSARC